VAIEVKSGLKRTALPGMAEFGARYRLSRRLLVGADGISVEEFLARPVEHWVQE
jgi:hypothetical protein